MGVPQRIRLGLRDVEVGGHAPQELGAIEHLGLIERVPDTAVHIGA